MCAGGLASRVDDRGDGQVIAFVVRWFWVGFATLFLSIHVAGVMNGSASWFTWSMIVFWTALLIMHATLAISRQVDASRKNRQG